MKPTYVSVVFALCMFSAFADDANTYLGSAREALSLYKECSGSDGLSPCLKIKALDVISRLGRMEKIELFDGLVVTGKSEENPDEPNLEQVEQTLPRALDAKNQALTEMMFNRIARMIGSKSIEISVPKFMESARKKEEDSKFGDIEELFDKFDDGKKGGHGGGHGGGLRKKMKKGKEGMGMKDFFMMIMAHKLAMIPLFIAGLFILAVKAFTQAKIALLIAGIIFAKKLMASKEQGHGSGGHGHVEHVSSGWSGGAAGGASGGWSSGGGAGGWNGGGGWDRRSLEAAQNLAYQAQQPQA
ncbi:unnamed protein product [Ceutorhynchus assimilis]|uniref:Uncharacterized protein n=1 Tax=Ceutorhynchus assimilis TaxID=467358 RepID=A0A9N9MI26_9CUCU|nr:unnamed protein product [Ceutorhynchus assimilis]